MMSVNRGAQLVSRRIPACRQAQNDATCTASPRHSFQSCTIPLDLPHPLALAPHLHLLRPFPVLLALHSTSPLPSSLHSSCDELPHTPHCCSSDTSTNTCGRSDPGHSRDNGADDSGAESRNSCILRPADNAPEDELSNVADTSQEGACADTCGLI